MFSPDNEVVLAYYLIAYVLLCIPTMFYLWRKGAGRKTKIGAFVAITGVLLVYVLRRLGYFPTFDWGAPPFWLSNLAILGIAGWMCYRERSLAGFLLFAAALGMIVSYSDLMDFAKARGASETSMTALSLCLGVVFLALLLSSVIVGCRSYFKRIGL